MTERTVRALVLLVMIPLAISGLAANVVIGHGSGTYYALVIYLGVVGVLAGIVWRAPQPRWLTLWAIAGGFASIVHQMVGNPYHREALLPGWPVVAWPLAFAVPLMVLGAPIVAVGRLPLRVADTQRPQLGVRIRRIAKVAAVLAVLGAIVMSRPLHATWTGVGLGVTIYLALALAPGVAVYRRPDRPTAIFWAAWSIPFFGVTSLFRHDLERLPPSWKLGAVLIGTMHALLLVGLPLACLVTREPDDRLPRARVR